MTTEQALKRLKILGFTIEDDVIKKSVDYMEQCLSKAKKSDGIIWYSNGHIDENDSNAVILRICLTDGILFSVGRKYNIDFI